MTHFPYASPHSPLGISSTLIPCPGLFQNLSAYNTRLFKEVDQDGKPRYEVRLASVLGTGELLSIYVGMVNLLLSFKVPQGQAQIHL